MSAQASTGARAVLVQRSTQLIDKELDSLNSAIPLLPPTAPGSPPTALALLAKHINRNPNFAQLELTLVLQWYDPASIDLATLGVGREGVEILVRYCREIGALGLAEDAEAAGGEGRKVLDLLVWLRMLGLQVRKLHEELSREQGCVGPWSGGVAGADSYACTGS